MGKAVLTRMIRRNRKNLLLTGARRDTLIIRLIEKSELLCTRIVVGRKTMSDADLRRLRRDLETMKQAAGLTLPFDWMDVWLALGLVPAGAAMTIWAAFCEERYLLVALIPAVLVALASGTWWGNRWRKEANRQAWRRETTFAWTSGILAGLAVAGYIFWGIHAGLSVASLKGAGIFSFGLMSGVLALTSPARRMYWAGAVVLIPLGLIIPFCTSKQTLIAGGVAMMAAGLLAALIQGYQLHSARRDHERNAN
jgi:hypothetical protein